MREVTSLAEGMNATRKERHGLLIKFLASNGIRYNTQNGSIDTVSVYFSPTACAIGSMYCISYDYDGEWNDITLKSALEYVSKEKTEEFDAMHPIDQYKYTVETHRSYEDGWKIFFCYACFTRSVSYYDLKCFFYKCTGAGGAGGVAEVEGVEGKGCDRTFCFQCVCGRQLDVDVVSSYVRSNSSCMCRRHDTLFDLLFSHIFVEKRGIEKEE